MVEENKKAIKVLLDPSVYDRLVELARESGLKVSPFAAMALETLTVDPLLQVLHENPAEARRIALATINGFLSGTPAVLSGPAPESVEPEPEPDPEPEPEPEKPDIDDELRKTIGELSNLVGSLSEKLKGKPQKEDESSEPSSPSPPDRTRRARPSPG